MLAYEIALQNNKNHLQHLSFPKNIIPQNIIIETPLYDSKTDCSEVNHNWTRLESF